MKYKVGDKLRYDGGDWWFYGTVSAVFEHSVCPCYRLMVERMEKKNCKLSITQFEFELEADNAVDSEMTEKRQMIMQLPEPEKEKTEKKKPEKEQKPELKQETEAEKLELIQKQEKKPQMRKTSDAWDRNLEMYRNGKINAGIHVWKSKNRKDYKAGVLSTDKLEKLKEINFPFVIERKTKPVSGKKKKGKDESLLKPKRKYTRKKRDEWDEILDAYRNGEKNNIISTWIAENKKQFKEDKLPMDKFEKLLDINFPFDVTIDKTPDSWDKQLEEWKNGNRKSIPIQQWKFRSIRQYSEGKLSGERILKLKQAGIL